MGRIEAGVARTARVPGTVYGLGSEPRRTVFQTVTNPIRVCRSLGWGRGVASKRAARAREERALVRGEEAGRERPNWLFHLPTARVRTGGARALASAVGREGFEPPSPERDVCTLLLSGHDGAGAAGRIRTYDLRVMNPIVCVRFGHRGAVEPRESRKRCIHGALPTELQQPMSKGVTLGGIGRIRTCNHRINIPMRV